MTFSPKEKRLLQKTRRLLAERPDLVDKVNARKMSLTRAVQIMNGATLSPHVYFLQPENGGPIKIGFSEIDIEMRLRQLQPWCPFKLKLLGVLRGNLRDERSVHRMFKADRLHGEWFRPSPRLLLMIEIANGKEIA